MGAVEHPVCLGKHLRSDTLSWPQVSPPWKSSGSLPCCPLTASSVRPWRNQPLLTAQSQDGCCATGLACSVSWGCFLGGPGHLQPLSFLGMCLRGTPSPPAPPIGWGGIHIATALHHVPIPQTAWAGHSLLSRWTSLKALTATSTLHGSCWRDRYVPGLPGACLLGVRNCRPPQPSCALPPGLPQAGFIQELPAV